MGSDRQANAKAEAEARAEAEAYLKERRARDKKDAEARAARLDAARNNPQLWQETPSASVSMDEATRRGNEIVQPAKPAAGPATQMDMTTVAAFSRELGLSAEAVLEQFRAAGVNKQSAEDSISEQDKNALLQYLRKPYCGTAETKSENRESRNPTTESGADPAEMETRIISPIPAGSRDVSSQRMLIRGWVYVMTNQAMPGLVKVGFTLKDPALRAAELTHTNNPHSFLVAYEALVQEPEPIERKVHAKLQQYREGREWFKCTVEVAVVAIKEAYGAEVITENYRLANAKLIAEQRAENSRIERVRARWRAQSEHLIGLAREELERKKKAAEPANSFFGIWVGLSICAFIVLEIIIDPKKEGSLLIPAAIIGAIASAFLKSHLDEKDKRRNGYYAAEEKYKQQLDEIGRLIWNPCPNCDTILKVNLPSDATTAVCPKCNAKFTPVFSLE